MPSIKDIITSIEHAEGDGKVTNDPADSGGRTQYGIAEKSNPAAWADGKVTEEEARAIYERKYVKAPGFDKIEDPGLQTQLIDFGVTSGPIIAVQKLQGILKVTADGVLGQETLHALSQKNPILINNELVKERVKMIGRIIHKNPSQLKWINGWLDRALQFLQ